MNIMIHASYEFDPMFMSLVMACNKPFFCKAYRAYNKEITMRIIALGKKNLQSVWFYMDFFLVGIGLLPG